MSELLQVVLTDASARGAAAQKVAAVTVSDAMQPWQDAEQPV